jgi:hypothetical protein
VKVPLVVIGYFICLLIELPAHLKLERKKLVLYILFMSIGLIEAIVVVTFKDLPSFASIIESIFKPIVNKIYGS